MTRREFHCFYSGQNGAFYTPPRFFPFVLDLMARVQVQAATTKKERKYKS